MADRSQRRVAVVTGGSRGIGAAIARRLAEDGHDVLITYQSSEDAARRVVRDIAERSGARAEAVRVDAADPEQPSRVADLAIERFGRLDVLVNNAGIFEAAPLAEATLDQFDRQFHVNVRAVFLATQAAAKVMAEGGRIVNIGSALGERVPMPGLGLYSATKFAVNGLTRGWARDLGPRGITVNAVQPGPIATDMNPDDGDFADTMRSAIPLGRYGDAEEVARAVAFLASPESGYLTGAILTVDGGLIA